MSRDASSTATDGAATGPGQPAVDLTVCVIGRNEGGKLPACAASLRPLRATGLRVEMLFVDSASTDRSADMAAQHFDTVVELAPSAQLNAGAARAVGSRQARGRWILYLDGDMLLREEFLPALSALVTGATTADGLAGLTRNVYPDGGTDLMVLVGNVDGEPCRAFGGAVVLRRELVLAAGNWAPNLFSNEESELYSRILRRSGRVLWTQTPMVDHVTARFASSHKLRGALLPWGSHLGKKFYGAGQATRRAWMHGHLPSFIRLKPLQYTMTAGLLGSLLGLAWAPTAAPWLAVAVFAGIAARRGPKFAVNCVCWTSQVLFGLARLDASFEPTLHRVRHTGPGGSAGRS